MKKVLLLLAVLSVLVFALAGTSYCWQGRMGGFGDPYGLLSDESDFLINPAGIAKGEGIKFYGHYRFTYTGVTDWSYTVDQLTLAGVLTNFYHFDTSGQEYKNNALLGAVTPLGPGRFGILFTYDGMRGDYDGNEDILGTSNYADYDLTKDLDNFALRLLYGQPVMGMDAAGIELGMAYRDEKQESWISTPVISTQNFVLNWLSNPPVILTPFMIPYDSNYWELLWKAGMEKQLGPLGINVSLRGGYIIASDNNYEYLADTPPGGPFERDVDMEGKVAGWRIGSDIWLRYAMGEGLTLPFMFSIDYAEKKRDGDAIGVGTSDGGALYGYEQQERILDLKAGGGVEKKLGNTALIGAGLYYNYLRGRDDFFINRVGGTSVTNDFNNFPFHREHRVIVKLAGELELSSAVTLRMGLEPFYGWVREDFESTYVGIGTDAFSVDGSHWGIGASLGGTVSFDAFTMEPFINGGWQAYDLDGDGERTNTTGTVTGLWNMDKSRSEWYIGGGCTFLYDLP